MKIVNLEQFRAMPPGTLFAKYTPMVFDALMIKGETWAFDFLYQDLICIESSGSAELFDKLEEAQRTGGSLKLDLDCQSRDGLFEKDQLFAVWEKPDLEQLIARLTIALNES